MANDPPDYAEAQVNDLMNAVYNNVNGEYVYLLQLGNDGEVIGASDEQGLQYVILKTDPDEVETTEISIEASAEHFQHHNHNGSEEMASEYEEQVFEGVREEQAETQAEGTDHEQVSAATNLLEFHNQQHSAVSESEFQSMETTEEHKPDTEELLKTLDSVKDQVVDTVKDEVIDKVTGQDLELKLSPPKRTYGNSSSLAAKTILKEGSDDAGSRKMNPARRKRRAIFDQVKVISNSEYKKQLQDTSDIVGKLELAPRTKKAMSHLTFSGVGKYFAYPGRRVHGMPLAQLFYTRLKVNVEATPDSQQPLQPLAADLRTPGSSDVLNSPPPPLEQYGSHECVETVLRKTVDSFDNMIKRMNTDKRKQRERKLKTSNIS